MRPAPSPAWCHMSHGHQWAGAPLSRRAHWDHWCLPPTTQELPASETEIQCGGPGASPASHLLLRAPSSDPRPEPGLLTLTLVTSQLFILTQVTDKPRLNLCVVFVSSHMKRRKTFSKIFFLFKYIYTYIYIVHSWCRKQRGLSPFRNIFASKLGLAMVDRIRSQPDSNPGHAHTYPELNQEKENGDFLERDVRYQYPPTL